MTERSTNASGAQFGFGFQSAAALVLIAQNLKHIESVRVEAKKGDIQLRFEDETFLIAEAKAFTNPHRYQQHAKAKLKGALCALAHNSAKIGSQPLKRIMYVSNSQNALLWSKKEIRELLNINDIQYGDFSDQLADTIKDILDKEGLELDLDKLSILLVPYFGEGEARYQSIDAYLNSNMWEAQVHPMVGHGRAVRVSWLQLLDEQVKDSEPNKEYSKSDLVWPLILLVIDQPQPIPDQLDIEALDGDRLTSEYRRAVHVASEQWTLVNQVMKQYNQNRVSGKQMDSFEFVRVYAPKFIEHTPPTMPEDLALPFMKLVIYKILTARNVIGEIKKVYGL